MVMLTLPAGAAAPAVSLARRLPRARREAYLAEICPPIGQQLFDNRHTPLAAMARSLFTAVPPVRGRGSVAAARDILVRELRPWMDRQLDAATAQALLAEFADAPVFQTGDHSELLLAPLSFANNTVASLGAARAGRSGFVVNGCSTVTLRTRAGTGPGLLQVGDCRVNLFGLTRRRLSSTSACASGPVQLRWQASGEPLAPAERAIAEEVRAIVGDRWFASVAEAMIEINSELWPWLAGTAETGKLPIPVFTDDRLTAAAVAAHLESRTSLYRVLFEEDPRRRLTHALRRLSTGPVGLALRTSTDFFWAVRDRRIRALRLVGTPAPSHLVEVPLPGAAADPAHCLRLPYHPDAIAESLRRGELFPDLLTGFSALSILPDAPVLGGTSQALYLPAIALVMAYALGLAGDSDLDESVAAAETGAVAGSGVRQRSSGVWESSLSRWLCGLWEPAASALTILADLPPADRLRRLHERLSGRPLGETVGNLSLFAYLGQWRRDLALRVGQSTNATVAAS